MPSLTEHPPLPTRAEARAYVEAHIEKREGHWIWTGYSHNGGKNPRYAFGASRKGPRRHVTAALMSWLAFVGGVIPPKHRIDVQCNESLCVNPEHACLVPESNVTKVSWVTELPEEDSTVATPKKLAGAIIGSTSAAVPVGNYEKYVSAGAKSAQSGKLVADGVATKSEPKPKTRATAANQALSASTGSEPPFAAFPLVEEAPAESGGATIAEAPAKPAAQEAPSPKPSRDNVLLQLVERVKTAEAAADNLRDKLHRERAYQEDRYSQLEKQYHDHLAEKDMEIEDLNKEIQRLEEEVKQAWTAQAEVKSEFSDEEAAALSSLGIAVR